MPEPSESIKVAKAKLYNLKSAIDGLIPLVDQGVLPPESVKDAVQTFAANIYDDLTKQGL